MIDVEEIDEHIILIANHLDQNLNEKEIIDLYISQTKDHSLISLLLSAGKELSRYRKLYITNNPVFKRSK